MTCLTDEQIVSLAIGPPDDTARRHCADCPACADRLAEVRTRMNQLEATLTATDRAHAAGRVRLLAALAAEPVPARPTLIRRIVMDRRNWVLTAAAAVLVAVVVLGWPGDSSAVVLAEALRPFKEAKSLSCDMVVLKGGKPWDESLPADKRGKLKTRLTWAAPGSLRLETTGDGQPTIQLILPHGKPGIIIDPAGKEYSPIDRKPDGKDEVVLRLINTLAEYTPGEKKPAATDEIDGVKAPRFDLRIAGADRQEWHYRIWAHPTTKRVLRVEFALMPGKDLTAEGVSVARLERFEWDVQTEGVFDTTPPAGYKRKVATPAETRDMTTQKVVSALRAYRDAAGGYPKTERFDAQKAAAEMEKLTKKKLDVETLQGFVLVGVLQSLSREAVYHGKTVGPDDKDKVLFRWKLDDGQYQVVFGDLKTMTVSGEKLKKLEGE